MPDYRHLTILLTLAACERADTTTTPEPKLAAEPLAPAPAPAPDLKADEAPAVAPIAPEPTPAATPEPVVVKKPTLPTTYELQRKCMSRAGCRWEREERPRVTKKPVVEEKP